MTDPRRSVAPADRISAALPVPDYLPPNVDVQRHRIGLIGCGGISGAQLAAYREAGFIVTVLCDRTLAKAESRRDEYFPEALATTAVADIWRDPAIDIVDIATHVNGRPQLVAEALRAGKNVLSQKPFVRNLDDGEALIALAQTVARVLAVNQNGRWAPHFAAALASVRRGDIGEVTSADFHVYWPHDQVFEHDPHFAAMQDLMLYDFGIHWFDLIAQLLSGAGEARRVFASVGSRTGQRIPVPTEADVVIEFDRARATICYRGSAPRLEAGSFRIEGTRGVITHNGESLGGSSVQFDTDDGALDLALAGSWWTNGMSGTMAELMSAIDDPHEPSNSGRSALDGLQLCFAALTSAQSGAAVDPRTIRTGPIDG